MRVGDRQANAAEHQAKIAQDALSDARATAANQRQDVELSRKAAQDSAKAAQDLAKGMERSARAAEASAKTGQESVTISRLNLLLSERPILESGNARLLRPLAVGDRVTIEVTTANTGKGPAYNINIEQHINISADWKFALTGSRTSHTDVLGAGSGFEKGSLASTSNLGDLTTTGLAEITNRRQFLYVFGIVEFEERILDRPEKQSYTYCYFYNPLNNPPTLGICPQQPPIPK